MRTVVPAEGAILERVLDTLPDGWRDGLSRRALGLFHAAQGRTAWAAGHQRRLALMDGATLLASAVRRDFAASWDAAPVRVAGIAQAFTDPAQAGSSHSCVLVDQLIDDAARDGADAALIEQRPDGSGLALSVPDGFTLMPQSDLQLTVTESSRHGAPMTLVRGGEDRDLAAMAAMGQVRAAAFRFHLHRDADLIKHAITRARLRAGLAAPGAREVVFVIAEEGITAAAYVVLSVAERSWTVEECGDRDPSGARVGAILQALIARAPSETRPVIRAWLPAGFVPPQVTVSRETPATDVQLMIRALTPAASRVRLTADDSSFWRSDLL